MAYKKVVSLSERDKTALRDFLACPVPAKYYRLDAAGNTKFDFNYSYQEVYDYADALLHGQEVSLNRNFLDQRDCCDKFAAATITIERLATKD